MILKTPKSIIPSYETSFVKTIRVSSIGDCNYESQKSPNLKYDNLTSMMVITAYREQVLHQSNQLQLMQSLVTFHPASPTS